MQRHSFDPSSALRPRRPFPSTASVAVLAALVLAAILAVPIHAAGVLTPVGAGHEPLRTVDHRVQVVLENGFSRTEVHQTFSNPTDRELEAVFHLPLPKSASLSEMTILTGDREIHGEVLPRDQARAFYEEEKQLGRDAGLGEKNDVQSFDFRVYPVRPGEDTTLRFVYYQPLSVDAGVGRYLYPLQEGGTDELAASFWELGDAVDGTLSIDVELRSAWPVADVRVPGFEGQAQVTEIGEGRYRILLERPQAALDTDFVLYYRLEAGLPGRVELITHRPDPSRPGTFMMVLTPALDLGPIRGGRDFVFVLDVSGSMSGKLGTLARGVIRALGKMNPEDRFRIVTFSNRAREMDRGWTPATPENVERAVRQLEGLRVEGGTNLYAGLDLGLEGLDDDRATSLILVTDGVTNQGILEPKAFHDLMKASDVRVFGFLLGNASNWPLMEVITDASGGFYAPVSNQDDLLGQVLLAQEKVVHESLHDAELEIDGVSVFEVTGQAPRKIYRGQQLVLFGRYDGSGPARVRLDAARTGEDVSYATTFDFPAQSDEHPELERLWALARIEDTERLVRLGLLEPSEGDPAVESLAVEYQLVTDQTAMVVMEDAAFEERGIERRNRDRTRVEGEARERRHAQPVRSYRVDGHQPMFEGRTAPSAGDSRGSGGRGAGAFGPWEALFLLLLGGGLAFLGRRTG